MLVELLLLMILVFIGMGGVGVVIYYFLFLYKTKTPTRKEKEQKRSGSIVNVNIERENRSPEWWVLLGLVIAVVYAAARLFFLDEVNLLMGGGFYNGMIYAFIIPVMGTVILQRFYDGVLNIKIKENGYWDILIKQYDKDIDKEKALSVRVVIVLFFSALLMAIYDDLSPVKENAEDMIYVFLNCIYGFGSVFFFTMGGLMREVEATISCGMMTFMYLIIVVVGIILSWHSYSIGDAYGIFFGAFPLLLLFCLLIRIIRQKLGHFY